MATPAVIKELSKRIAILEAKIKELESRKKPGPKPKDKDVRS